jgi:hypothetical protein
VTRRRARRVDLREDERHLALTALILTALILTALILTALPLPGLARTAVPGDPPARAGASRRSSNVRPG